MYPNGSKVVSPLSLLHAPNPAPASQRRLRCFTAALPSRQRPGAALTLQLSGLSARAPSGGAALLSHRPVF